MAADTLSVGSELELVALLFTFPCNKVIEFSFDVVLLSLDLV